MQNSSTSKPRLLVACEFTGVVREMFGIKGWDAWSCDLEPTEWPGQHLQGDVLEAVYFAGPWDLIIAHPPCTHLAVSGARHFKEKQQDGRQKSAIDFFLAIANAPVTKIAIENPVCIMSSIWRQPDQTIQPWQFGHPESKTTCLWLKGLPLLKPTEVLTLPPGGRWENQTWSGQNKLGASPSRGKIRSKTYTGIARAMSEQWGTITT